MTLRPDSALRVYKFRGFARFARKARISDADLWHAAKRANEGQIAADLGGGVIKQRIAREGEGKSGGSRSILLLKKVIARFSSQASRRRTEPISTVKSLKQFGNSP